MPELHLKQPQFTYSACVPFLVNERIRERINIFLRGTDNLKHFHSN